jgi:membrane protease subunit (stomatin/prohibitin family)
MKKTTILLFTVLLFFMWSRLGAGQEQVSAQKELSIEEQVRILDGEIKASDTLINEIDAVIVLYQQQQTALVNKRAELNALKEILRSALVINSRSLEQSKGHTGDAVLTTAGVVGSAATGNIVGTTVAGSQLVNQLLNTAIHQVDEHNARIEKTLKEQREWKATHPGKNKK